MSPRKSTRARKDSKYKDEEYALDKEGEEGEWAQEEGDSEEEVRQPSKKKSKKGNKEASGGKSGAKSKRTTKKKNKLEVFNTMPLDVLIEILGHLDPKTLLAASRTCSVFRRVLHSDGGNSIWKSARRNVGLSDLQRPDVEEWELAQLLYDGTCVVCGKTRAVTIDYVLCVRACANCMKDNSKQRSNLIESRYHARAFDVVPSSLWSPYFDGPTMEFFWKPMLARVTNQLNDLDDKPDALAEFVKARQNIKKQARSDARVIESWLRNSKRQKEDEKADKRDARFEKIKEKLRLEGYDEQDLRSWELSRHPDVNNARDLSENVWTRIKPALNTLLDAERTRRLDREAVQRQRSRAFALKSFYQQIETSLPLPSVSDLRTYYPPFANFLSLPAVQPLYTPEGYVPSTEDLAAAKPRILAEVQSFAKQIQKAVSANLLSAFTQSDPDFKEENFSMPSCLAAVKCLGCRTYSTFPSILEHLRLCCGDRQVISEDSFTTTPRKIKTIRQIIEAVKSSGREWSEACSVAELYALGDTFECETCELGKAQQPTLGVASWGGAYKTKELNWAVLLDHVERNHAESSPVTVKYSPPAPPAADPNTLVQDDSEAGEGEGDA